MLLPFLAPRTIAEIQFEMNETATGFGDGTVSVIARSGRESNLVMQMTSREGRGLWMFNSAVGKMFVECDRSQIRILDTTTGFRKLVRRNADSLTALGSPKSSTAEEQTEEGFRFELEDNRVRMWFSQDFTVRSESVRKGIRTVELERRDEDGESGRMRLRYRVGTFFPMHCESFVPGEKNSRLSFEFQPGRAELGQLRIPNALWDKYPDKQDR